MNKEELKKLVMAKFNLVEAKFGSAKLEDGTEVSFEGDTIAVDSVVNDAEGNVLADGSYVAEDGSSFTITEGKVSEVVPVEEEMAEDADEVPAEALSVEQVADAVVSILEETLAPVLADVVEMKAQFAKFSKKEEAEPASVRIAKYKKLEGKDGLSAESQRIVERLKARFAKNNK